MLLPLVAIAGAGLMAFRSSVGAIERFGQEVADEARTIGHVRDLLAEADAVSEAYVEDGDPTARDRFANLHAELDQGFNVLKTLSTSAERTAAAEAWERWEVAVAAVEAEVAVPARANRSALLDYNDPIDEAASLVADAYALNVSHLRTEIGALRQREREQLLIVLAILVFSSFAAALLAQRVHRSITVPLLSLTKAASDFGPGDLSRRVPVSGDDELARLGKAFNDMAERLQEGKRELAAVVAQDMADRARMEADLRASEELFRNAFGAGKAGMALIDLDNRYLSVNDSFCKMVGYTREELLTLGWMRLTHPDDREVNLDLTAQLLAGEATSYLVRKRYLHRDGRVIWVEVSDAVFRSPEGEPLYTVSQIQDVTERKVAEVALEANQSLLKGIIDNSPSAIYIKKADGTYLLASKAFLKAFDLELDDVIGKTAFELFPVELATQYEAVDSEVISTQRPVELEELALHAGGSHHVYRSLKFPLFDQHQQCYGMCGVSEDVTEHNRAEADRERLHTQLRQGQKMEAVGQLAGGIAHDFNNILAVILNYGEFLTEDLDVQDPRRGDVQEIIKAGEKAAQLVHQLLAFSRQEVVEPRVVDVGVVVAGLHKLLRSSIGEDIDLIVEAAPNLPFVLADEGHLEQVVLNLVVNARDAMPRGGVLSIVTSTEELAATTRPGLPPGPYVHLLVTDTGTGMEPETMDRIFEPFFTTKARGEGTGLGLATVYGLVKQANGGIYVDSASGRGASFSVYLPVTDQKAGDLPEPPAVSTGGTGAETILVVEDEPGVREVVSRILTKSGYSVVALPNGAEALTFCEGNVGDVDLLLTDVVMPEMSGKALADSVLALRSDMRTIFMSGYTDEIIAQRGVLGKGEHLIMKPFRAEELVNKVRTVLGAGKP